MCEERHSYFINFFKYENIKYSCWVPILNIDKNSGKINTSVKKRHKSHAKKRNNIAI